MHRPRPARRGRSPDHARPPSLQGGRPHPVRRRTPNPSRRLDLRSRGDGSRRGSGRAAAACVTGPRSGAAARRCARFARLRREGGRLRRPSFR
jgi:hypothetical protein